MAKSLTKPEAFAVAEIVVGRSLSAPQVAELVRSHLVENSTAQEALTIAEQNPDSVGAIYDLADHVRKIGKNKKFRAVLRSRVGYRKYVAAIGVAQRTARVLADQDDLTDLTRLVKSRIDGQDGTLANLKETPSDPSLIQSLAQDLQEPMREREFRERVRALWRPPGPKFRPKGD
ncbi:hypothetical protein AB0F11_02245 [Streptomyces sp. NPDC032472]|uniref:hypothetical protein n=1 Tax=Streptomyces sp. NPDC032472 TaxID=3155018 RepID=UPI0033FDE67A